MDVATAAATLMAAVDAMVERGEKGLPDAPEVDDAPVAAAGECVGVWIWVGEVVFCASL